APQPVDLVPGVDGLLEWPVHLAAELGVEGAGEGDELVLLGHPLGGIPPGEGLDDGDQLLQLPGLPTRVGLDAEGVDRVPVGLPVVVPVGYDGGGGICDAAGVVVVPLV